MWGNLRKVIPLFFKLRFWYWITVLTTNSGNIFSLIFCHIFKLRMRESWFWEKFILKSYICFENPKKILKCSKFSFQLAKFTTVCENRNSKPHVCEKTLLAKSVLVKKQIRFLAGLWDYSILPESVFWMDINRKIWILIVVKTDLKKLV